jgi:hypothetical protein
VDPLLAPLFSLGFAPFGFLDPLGFEAAETSFFFDFFA